MATLGTQAYPLGVAGPLQRWEVRAYNQFDGERDPEHIDNCFPADRDGDIIFGPGAPTWELRRSDIPVRAMIAIDADPVEAARMLRKFAESIERHGLWKPGDDEWPWE